MKFKVGDKVRVLRSGKQEGFEGIVKVVTDSPYGYHYIVFFPDRDSNDFKESELEFVNEL